MNPTYDFTGQVAVVTGAAAGMGLDTARAFAAAGAAVVLSDVNEQALRAASDELTAAGHRALGVTCDVADETQVAALVDRTVAEFGRLDMAYNNAGIMLPLADAAEEPAEAFDRVSAVNLRGVWACMKHELRQMREQGSGAIVNCSSLGGLVGNPGRAAYHATKHGVLGLTKSAALEYAPHGIRINAVCPGTIETPMVADMMASGELTVDDAIAGQPIGRLGRADEIAAAVLWLCSPGASLVVGVALPVDGGYTARCARSAPDACSSWRCSRPCRCRPAAAPTATAPRATTGPTRERDPPRPPRRRALATPQRRPPRPFASASATPTPPGGCSTTPRRAIWPPSFR
jgi:NAD(P)-dependent dehydrogenase (short-subunit alcohol dehydrogenase family)